MTNEEAISLIQTAKAEIEWEYPMEYAEAFEQAINALEKQVPKKPVKGELYFECANCGETRIDYRYFPLSRPKLTYCASCGQAILWTISACGEKGIDQAACDYAERLQEILNKAEDE